MLSKLLPNKLKILVKVGSRTVDSQGNPVLAYLRCHWMAQGLTSCCRLTNPHSTNTSISVENAAWLKPSQHGVYPLLLLINQPPLNKTFRSVRSMLHGWSSKALLSSFTHMGTSSTSRSSASVYPSRSCDCEMVDGGIEAIHMRRSLYQKQAGSCLGMLLYQIQATGST